MLEESWGRKSSLGTFIIENCYNIGNINSGSLYGGGIGGTVSGGEIINCYNKADITGQQYVGGVLGYSGYFGNVTLTNCWNEGNVSGTKNISDICAYVFSGTLTVNNCYNISERQGCGIVSESRGGTTTIYNTFIVDKKNNGWSVLTSGGWESPTVNMNKFYYKETTYNNVGAGTINGTPIECTDASMKTQSFVDELNANIENGCAYEQENAEGETETITIDTTGWAKWVYNENDYPTLDTSTTWNATSKTWEKK